MNIKKLQLCLISLIIATIGLCGVFYKYTCDKNSKRFYKQGVNLFNEKKYSDAYYNFKQINRFSNLYELSLLKQYQCANNLADKKTAHIKLKEIIKYTKNDIIKPWALYNETLLSQELKTTQNEIIARKFKIIYTNYPNNDFGIASAYKYAQLSKNNSYESKEGYLKYLTYAPNGKYALSALEELSKIETELTKEEYEIIADAKYANSQYTEAIANYEKTVFSKNWYKISKCYRALNNKNKEKETIQKGLNLKISNVNEKELSIALDRFISITNANKIQFLQELYNKYQDSYVFPTIAYKLAEASSSPRAIKLYETVANDYPTSIWASNSLWEIFWYSFQEGHYKNCENIARKHISLYKDSQDAPRIAYWYGRALLKTKNNQHAREIFYDIINDYPLSYYSFLSAKRLKMSKSKKMILRKPIVSYNINSINKFIFKDKTLLKLANSENWELIDDFKIDDSYVKAWIAHKKKNYPTSINIAKKELFEEKEEEIEINIESEEKNLSFSNQFLKLVYPVLYEKEINESAKDYEQSPYLFLSLIREESHFDKNAKSPVGALGLSQLMPSTANFIENKQVTKDTLVTPDKNIKIGLKYFTYLVDYFDNDEYLAILAYNAGPGNIKKWRNNPSINSNEIDVFVENIPYIETKNYIKKILSSYWTYINIYSTKNI
ncbi:transglycosylase SLT domain-containing protein [bacterium]|nr:transglycosylase SLT domain-containing protein [bacterium]